MVSAFIFAVAIAGWASLPVRGIPWPGPSPTTYQIGDQLGLSIKPTADPQADAFDPLQLFRRQTTASTDTCGFINRQASSSCELSFLGTTADHRIDWPLTCKPGRICATDADRQIMGCCVEASLHNCSLLTSCIPSSALPSCGADCQSNPNIAKW